MTFRGMISDNQRTRAARSGSVLFSPRSRAASYRGRRCCFTDLPKRSFLTASLVIVAPNSSLASDYSWASRCRTLSAFGAFSCHANTIQRSLSSRSRRHSRRSPDLQSRRGISEAAKQPQWASHPRPAKASSRGPTTHIPRRGFCRRPRRCAITDPGSRSPAPHRCHVVRQQKGCICGASAKQISGAKNNTQSS